MKIQPIEPQLVDHFNPDGTHIGLLNEYEHIQLRIEIAKDGLEGYYMIFKDERVYFDKFGCFPYTEGLFTFTMKQLKELIGHQMIGRINEEK